MADVLERDAGFCSGGDDDDMEGEDGIHSPTDASEDSVDVKVQAICFRNRNKRKCAEPRKLDSDLPAKKRKINFSAAKTGVESSVCNPFRPWSASPPAQQRDQSSVRFSDRVNLPLNSEICSIVKSVEPLVKEHDQLKVISLSRLMSPQHVSSGAYPPNLTRLLPVHVSGSYTSVLQEEPLSLVSKRKDGGDEDVKVSKLSKVKNVADVVPDSRLALTSSKWYQSPKELVQVVTTKVPSVGGAADQGGCGANRVKVSNCEKKSKGETKTKADDVSHQNDSKFRIDSLLSSVKAEGSSGASTSKSSQGGQQRNYKNMTRERRIEANARERTRVHTISAAFDTLRHSIPAYSHNQKLSKLSVLRIACSYIMTLSRLAGFDYSKDQSSPDLSNCVDNVSKTIQTEGKIRKKKED